MPAGAELAANNTSLPAPDAGMLQGPQAFATMDRSLRIALAEFADGLLADRLRALPSAPQVDVYASLDAAVATVAQNPPEVLVIGAAQDATDLPGKIGRAHV